jgi:hypothetical protein
VLILDEPANGLDPAGIRWMRDLLTGFASQGGTVLLSSHLLHEIEVIADDLVVIGTARSSRPAARRSCWPQRGRSSGRRHRATSRTPSSRPGSPARSAGDGSVRTDADPAQVGAVALTRASPSPSSGPPRAPGSKTCSCRSLPTPNAKELRHDRHDRPAGHHHGGRTGPPCRRPLPTTRLVKVELRKMFTTRSGFWMLVSIGVLTPLSAGSVLVFAPDSDVTYESFARASGFPMSVILPMIAILAVTSEWSQRSGLTTFTLVPSRGRVIGAKAIATLLVGLGSVALAFAVGALGNVAGSALAGVDTVWDISLSMAPQMVLFNLVGMAIGFTLGVVLRNSAGAIVGYFVVSLVLPGILVLLAQVRSWFEDLQPWIDWNETQVALLEGAMTPVRSGRCSLDHDDLDRHPLVVGLLSLRRSEVK